jgi:hypothetical protein
MVKIRFELGQARVRLRMRVSIPGSSNVMVGVDT